MNFSLYRFYLCYLCKIIARSYLYFHPEKCSKGTFTNINSLFTLVFNVQEEIRDLLHKDQNKRLELKERPDTGIYVKARIVFAFLLIELRRSSLITLKVMIGNNYKVMIGVLVLCVTGPIVGGVQKHQGARARHKRGQPEPRCRVRAGRPCSSPSKFNPNNCARKFAHQFRAQA